MNERKDFDISEYLKDGVVYLENLRIEDHRIAGLQTEWRKTGFVIVKCVFNNVEFDNHCGRGYARIEGCEFINCVFHDTLGSGRLEVEKNVFRNCIFEGVSICGVNVSRIANCSFLNCDFNKIDLKWKTALYDLEIDGGKIEHSSIVRGSIKRIKISDMHMEHMQLRGNFYQNRMESVVFKDVSLVGNMGDTGTEKENIFVDCDTDEFIFKEGSLGFESLCV